MEIEPRFELRINDERPRLYVIWRAVRITTNGKGQRHSENVEWEAELPICNLNEVGVINRYLLS